MLSVSNGVSGLSAQPFRGWNPEWKTALMTTSANQNSITNQVDLASRTCDSQLDTPDSSPPEEARDTAKDVVKFDVSDEEVQQMRNERLEAIRRAVESGAYDSEELLEKSVRLMMERIDANEELP